MWNTLTMGCPAAHSKGFTNGGASRIETDLRAIDDRKPRTKGSDAVPSGLNSQCLTKPWLELEYRMNIVRCQILSAVAASVCSMIELASTNVMSHKATLQVIEVVGHLVNFESLLSTHVSFMNSNILYCISFNVFVLLYLGK